MFSATNYSLANYGSMISDKIRVARYVAALRYAVTPNSAVLDLGAGIGFFSLLSCEFGARRVYAIEPSDSIHLGIELAQTNGFHERISFIQDMSLHVNLPEPVDVIVSDLRGTTPLFEHHIPSIIDARNRFLIQGGSLIPQQDILWATLVESDENYIGFERPWRKNQFKLDLSAGSRLIVNNIRRLSTSQGLKFLTDPVAWAKLDYTTIQNPNLNAKFESVAVHSGTAHGLCVWFDSILFKDIGFSNHPKLPKLIYGSLFFPLEEPVRIVPGNIIRFDLAATLVDQQYIWRWNTTITEGDGNGTTKATYRQSTFFSHQFSLSKLRKCATGFTPNLNRKGQAERFALNMMDGTHTLDEIARALIDEFYDQFEDEKDALAHVAKLSLHWG